MKALKNTQGEWDWSKITVGIITLIVFPLVALTYTNVLNALDTKANKNTTELQINLLKEKVALKADDKTIILLLEQQNKELEERRIIEKETLKTLQNLNIQMKVIQERIK